MVKRRGEATCGGLYRGVCRGIGHWMRDAWMVEIEFRGWARVLLVAEDGSGQSLLFFLFINLSVKIMTKLQ